MKNDILVKCMFALIWAMTTVLYKNDDLVSTRYKNLSNTNKKS